MPWLGVEVDSSVHAEDDPISYIEFLPKGQHIDEYCVLCSSSPDNIENDGGKKPPAQRKLVFSVSY